MRILNLTPRAGWLWWTVACACQAGCLAAFDDPPRTGSSVSAVDMIHPLDEKVLASDAQSNDRFGWSVAISGDVAIVGAIDEDDSGTVDSGAAYVLERDAGGAGSWGEIRKLLAADKASGDGFGVKVAVSGDVAAVAAAFEDSLGTTDNGAVYLFYKDAGGVDNWGQVKKLMASDRGASDFFGASVAIAGDVIIIGAPSESEARGAAYVFARDQGGADNWGEVKKLVEPSRLRLARFGSRVALDGDIAVVGSPGATLDVIAGGGAHLFGRDVGGNDSWGFIKELAASDQEDDDDFGSDVAILGDIIAVGARREDDSGTIDSGAVYLFERDAGGVDAWGQIKKLMASDKADNDEFGTVKLLAGTVVVGAWSKDAPNAVDSGAAYVYIRDYEGVGNWGEHSKIVATNPSNADGFATGLALGQGVALLGSDRTNDGGRVANGSVYVCRPSDGCLLSLPGQACGDGEISGQEECDDGNLAGADGCSASCGVEAAWSCGGAPSVCEMDGEDSGGGGGCSAALRGTGMGPALLLLVTLGGLWRRRRA